TEHSGRQRTSSTTLRERAAAEELSAPPGADDHRRATELAHVLREHRLGLLTFDRSRVLALLRVILAGKERPEEAAARLELAAALGTARIRHRREIVRLGDERAGVDLVEPSRERRVEVLENLLPAEVTLFDLVELLFHLRREIHVEDVRELFDHHLLDALTKLRREEAALIELDVVPVAQHRDDRRVRRRTADAEPLELLHEARLGETRRRLREVLARRDALARHFLADVDDRQRLFVLERLALALLACLTIERQEALELHDRPGGAEQIAAAPDTPHDRFVLWTIPLGLNEEVDGRRVEDGRRHLRRHEPLPDELIELELVGAQILLDRVRTARRIRRADRFVRVLSVL